VHSLGYAVSRAYTSPPKRGEETGAALTTNAAQVAGLGRIYFDLPGYGFHEPHQDMNFSA
jgi:GTP-binding protein EngB required for normal cell division